MSRRLLYTISSLYLYIPLAIFLVGWTWWWLGIPLAAAGLAVCLSVYGKVEGRVKFGSAVTEWIVAAALLLWAVHAGIGEFAWQNRGDHLFRNAVFYTLCDNDWPAIRGSDMLCYYFGFWLPAASAVKLTGSMLLGRIVLVLWAATGLWLAMRLVFEAIGRVRLRILLVFIFFSGVDIIPFYLYGRSVDVFLANGWVFPAFGGYSPLAWWTDHCGTLYWIYNQIIPAWVGCMLVLGKAPSRAIPAVLSFMLSPLAWWTDHCGTLYWIYNQIIPAWVGCMLVLGKAPSRAIPAVLSFMLISCPVPAVALFPAGAYRWVSSAWRATLSLSRCVAKLLGWRVWAAVILAVPVGLLFMANTSTATHTSIYAIDSLTRLLKVSGHIGLLLLFEIGVFVPFVWRWIKRDTSTATHTSIYAIDSLTRLLKVSGHIGLLLLFEIGVFVPFVWRWIKRDPLLYILLVTSICALFVRTGLQGMDFASRTSIPLILYMSVATARFVCDWRSRSRAVRIAFICIAVIALPGPLCEVCRTTYKCLTVPCARWADSGLKSIFDPSVYRDNFVAPASSWHLSDKTDKR